MNHPFGWHYQPGAEHDPHAPWNQDDIPTADDLGWSASALIADEPSCDCGGALTQRREPTVEPLGHDNFRVFLDASCKACGDITRIVRRCSQQ